MQMSIEARSEEGKLTVFSLAVPISTVKPALQKKTPAITNYGQLTQRIMVLDDDADVREAIAQLLIRWGAEVDLCRNRAEAFEAASIQAPDIIITDRQLAENENGIDVVQAMIDSLKLDCEVIVMTADTTPEAIRQTSLSGFKALNKPVKPAQLRIVISNLG
jgi:DNA-binding NtrC family response regulator